MSGNPDYVAYTVRERGVDSNGEKRDPFWSRIGAAFATKGDGLSVVLDSLPIDGRIVLRRPKADDDKGGERADAKE